jgi:hypothetical protein
LKLDEIDGPALDALAARAFGLAAEEIVIGRKGAVCLVYLPTVARAEHLGIDAENIVLGEHRIYAPSGNWSHAGALSDIEDISVDRSGERAGADGAVYAYAPGSELDGQFGATAPEAITRCFIAQKLGCEIPDEWVLYDRV